MALIFVQVATPRKMDIYQDDDDSDDELSNSKRSDDYAYMG